MWPNWVGLGVELASMGGTYEAQGHGPAASAAALPPAHPQVLEDSLPRTPLVFVLSPGVDPAPGLLQLAEQVGMALRLHALSLGQGQAPIATRMIQEGVRHGEAHTRTCAGDTHVYGDAQMHPALLCIHTHQYVCIRVYLYIYTCTRIYTHTDICTCIMYLHTSRHAAVET